MSKTRQGARRAALLTGAAVAMLALAVDVRAADAVLELGPVTVEGGTQAAPMADGYRPLRSKSATKTDTPLNDVPQAVHVVTADLVKDQGKRGLGESLEYIPGIKVGQGEGNRDQVTIRGQNSTSDFFSNGIRDDLEYYRDTYNVERVEALMGPNAMIFGRGGGGGIVNRVIKDADGKTIRRVGVQVGSFDTKRTTADVGQAINGKVAARINGMVEKSGSFREHVETERFGINPTVSVQAGDRTRIKLGYEYFDDDRTADRGLPSQNGRVFTGAGMEKFFGNPDLSYATTANHVADLVVEHEFRRGLSLTNKTRYADYEKFYQNVYPNSEVSAAGTYTAGAYNNLTGRENLFNQTDLEFSFATGPVRHKTLTGIELGRQDTANLRKTGANTTNVSAFSPTFFTPVAITTVGASNDTTADVAAAYVQDQVDVTEQWQVIGGLRLDRFDIEARNNLTGQSFGRTDHLVSPRLGVVFKPVAPLSLYTSYSVSYLPGSGNQFGSLTTTTEALEPERFRNLELGAKWELQPSLAVTAALYQLDRSKTQSATVNGVPEQTGAQRTRGGELGVSGRILEAWEVMGGYAYQQAEIVKGTSAAPTGSSVAQVPKHTVSLWNKVRFDETWAAGLGAVYQSDMYANTGNPLAVAGYARFDAAIYANVTEGVRAQLNVQNLLEREYFAAAHNQNNISPGAPRTFLLSLTSDF